VATILIFFWRILLTRLSNLVEFKRMLMFCLEDWVLVGLVNATDEGGRHILFYMLC